MIVLKIELLKIIKKRSNIAVCLFFLLVPILFAILIVTGNSAINVSGKLNIYFYCLTIWGLLQLLMAVYLIPMIAVTSNLGKELSEHSISMYLIRSKRHVYYIYKLVANLIFALGLFIVFTTSSFISFSMILSHTEYIESNTYPLSTIIYMFLLTILELLLVIVIAHTMSVFLKNIGGAVVSFLIIVVMMIIENIEAIAEYTPTFISDFVRVMDFSSQELIKDIISAGPVMLIYFLVFFFAGLYRFKKMDFS